MVTEKILSCTAIENRAEDFSKTAAIDYIIDTLKEYKPVLYVIGSENAKSINKYAKWQEEEEYVYPPGSIFRSVEVDEETVPGLAIIYLQEVH